MLCEDILKEFIFDCKMRKLSERTIKSYRNNNLAFIRFISQEYEIDEIEDVNHLSVKGYIESLSVRGLTEAYVNSIIKNLRAYFHYASEEGYLNRNPMDKVKFQKEPLSLIIAFNNDEVSRMLKYYKGSRYLDVRNQFIMILLLDTGMRNTELCGLKLSDIRDTYINIYGKGKKIRHVPITPIINKQLIKYMRIREAYTKGKFNYDNEYLLLSQKGKKLTIETIERIVKECGEASRVRREVRISPHTCRHYYAQNQLKNGCDLFTVSKLLGHININITKRYLQSMSDEDVLSMAIETSPLMNL